MEEDSDHSAIKSDYSASLGDEGFQSSESDWKEEAAASKDTEAEVKEQLRILTKGFTLCFKDIKDSELLQMGPLQGVPTSRIQNVIKYKRSARGKKENLVNSIQM